MPSPPPGGPDSLSTDPSFLVLRVHSHQPDPFSRTQFDRTPVDDPPDEVGLGLPGGGLGRLRRLLRGRSRLAALAILINRWGPGGARASPGRSASPKASRARARSSCLIWGRAPRSPGLIPLFARCASAPFRNCSRHANKVDCAIPRSWHIWAIGGLQHRLDLVLGADPAARAGLLPLLLCHASSSSRNA